MKKTLTLLALTLVIIFSANICLANVPNAESIAKAEKYFLTDVDVATELGASIKKLVDAGVVNGIPQADGTYIYSAPSPITRAQFCKMVNITFDYKIMADNIFWDVHSDQWYYPQILTAIHYGYIQGMGDGSFRGDEYITREQVCVILERVLKREAQTNPEVKWEAQTKPQIKDEVSDWARSAVENIVGLGYISLEEGGIFRAKKNMTRGEFAFALDDFVKTKTDETKPDDETKPEDKTDKEDKNENNGGNNSGNNSGNGYVDDDDDGYIGGDEGEDEDGDEGGDNSQITETTYKIAYKLNGGTLSGQKTTYKKSDADYTLPEPKRNGYEFGGWYEKADFSTEPITVLVSKSTGDKTYYARWHKTYKISYVLHPKEYLDENDPDILGKLDGTQKTTYTEAHEDYDLPIPTRDDGAEFMGWYVAQTYKNVKDTILYTDEYRVDTIVKGTTGDLTFHAVWDDMVNNAEFIYGRLSSTSEDIVYQKENDLLPQAVDSGVLAFFETAIPEVVAWQDDGVLVTNRLVRAVYKDQAEELRVIYLAWEDKETLEGELGQIQNVQTLVTLFNINLGFGDE